jgi:hypothetical protein
MPPKTRQEPPPPEGKARAASQQTITAGVRSNPDVATSTSKNLRSRRFTLKNNEEAFDHIMLELLDLDEESNIYLALEQAGFRSNVDGLLMISDAEIRTLTYPVTDSAGKITQKPAHTVLISGLLLRWRSYLAYREAMNIPVYREDYVSIFHTRNLKRTYVLSSSRLPSPTSHFLHQLVQPLLRQ